MTEQTYRTWERLAGHVEVAWSSGREVSATVGAGGELRALWLDPRIYRDVDADRLAATILDTVRAAADQAHQHAAETMAPLLGGLGRVKGADLAFDPILQHLEARERTDPWR